MESFQTIVLLVAILILIVTLILIGYALRKAAKSREWPPMIPQCPDYWTVDASNNKCMNTKNLGKCNNVRSMDFNVSPYTGDQGLCNKYKWATRCGIAWDGITYGVKNPCFQSK